MSWISCPCKGKSVSQNLWIFECKFQLLISHRFCFLTKSGSNPYSSHWFCVVWTPNRYRETYSRCIFCMHTGCLQSQSKYWVSINLWQWLEFNTAIFGIFLFCHAVTITRNRVTKIICIAIFWSYLPRVAASVTPGIHIILRWPLEVESHMCGPFRRGGNFCFASELVLRQLQPIWQSDYRNGDRCQIWPELESKEKIETVPIFLTIQTNSDCGFVVSFGLWITIFVKMAKTGETTIVAANSL